MFPGKRSWLAEGYWHMLLEAIWDGVSRDGPVSVLFSWRDYTIELEKPIRRGFFFFLRCDGPNLQLQRFLNSVRNPHFSTRTIRKSVAERAGCSKQALLFEENVSLIQSGINETITKLSWNFEENRTRDRFYFSNKKKRKKWNRQRKVSWRGDRTWVHDQNGLHDVRTDLKSCEVLLPITRLVVRTAPGEEFNFSVQANFFHPFFFSFFFYPNSFTLPCYCFTSLKFGRLSGDSKWKKKYTSSSLT